MLVAVLNTCTKEELQESDDDSLISPTSSHEETAECRRVIKSKILAVGRMARVFALLRFVSCRFYFLLSSHFVRREESEKVSELKSVSGSNKLPYGTLALGSEGIKDAITGFEDACVFIHPSTQSYYLTI
jgi:serine/threonine-protein phosphatase 2B catalytic subunit